MHRRFRISFRAWNERCAKPIFSSIRIPREIRYSVRTSPIRPIHHDFHAAADGQLGYRDWRISGDDDWIRRIYPQLKQSLDYCIRTWDPREAGALEEPHHHTCDIEFWRPDGMCTSFYAGALNSFVQIGQALKRM